MKRDFIVNVTKHTQSVSRQGFGLILILGTSKEVPYTLVGGVDEVDELFGVESEEYKIASRIFGQSPAPQEIAVVGVEYDAETDQPTDLISALNEIINRNGDWFHLVCTENSSDIVSALGEWVDANNKMYWVTTQDLSQPATMENENAIVMYHHDEDAYVAEGLATFAATTKPGEITFKFKQVKGVTAADISSTELKELHKNGGFSYVEKMGVLQTSEGKTTSGEYIDVVLGNYFLKFGIEEELMYLAINSKKIGYDNVGIGSIVSVFDKKLKQGTRNGIVLKDENENGVYEITALSREEVSKLDIADRIYNGVKVEYKLAGAIHEGTFQIIATY